MLIHLRYQDQTVVCWLFIVHWPLYVCSYKCFASRAKGKFESEIRGRLLVPSLIVDGTLLPWDEKDKIRKFSALEQISWKILSIKPQRNVKNSSKNHSDKPYLVAFFYTYCCVHVNWQVGWRVNKEQFRSRELQTF